MRSCTTVHALVSLGIVGGFLGDFHVVWMAFRKSRAGNAYKLAVFLQRRDVAATAVAHARAQSAAQLVDGVGNFAFVCNASFYSFGDEFFVFRHAALEVAVG